MKNNTILTAKNNKQVSSMEIAINPTMIGNQKNSLCSNMKAMEAG